ncbi:DMT family transporter [Rubrivivax gelatinosus]|uniref:DMT family transporter n=1 Tax=Rubrivivax gelatinosus TaxID=28068 RepID=UPI0003012F11|nr:DMT family transporter [Rubrivivax gelatinosus]MBG6081598.1 S-adenosylmethionine uptake transporter [Rubrivivax gelatinosus]
MSRTRAAPGPLRAPLLITGAAFLFAAMGLCVKLASAHYGAGEIVMYRSAVGVVLMALMLRAGRTSLATRVPWLHLQRSAAGLGGMCLWFYALGALPLATGMTLNYTSSVWVAVFVVGAAWGSGQRPDARLVIAVLAGFGGVALILQPTLETRQLLHGLAGLVSGLLSARAYLHVRSLGQAGEPEERIVFYFSVAGVAAGALLMLVGGGPHPHTLRGALLLLATGALASAAQLMLTRAYAIGQAMTNAVLQYLGIVFSFGFGVWLFDDPVTLSALAGMALIVAAGIAATWLARTPRVTSSTDIHGDLR